MLKKFSAQNFDGELVTALDFNESSAVTSLYYAKNGDITPLKRLLQLLWASTVEENLALQYKLNSVPHVISSSSGKIYFDNDEIKFPDLEKKYLIKYQNYSKAFVLTYTQLLNMELSRTDPKQYLNKYIFHKPDSKSYYSPIEDVFYDIEQAKKYSGEISKEEVQDKNLNEERIVELESRIKDLEENKSEHITSKKDLSEKIQSLEKLLSDQKKLDAMLIEKDDNSKKLNLLSQKIKQYEEALLKVSQHDGDMAKYNNFIKLNVQRVENDLAMFNYRVREREKVISDTVNIKPTLYTEAAKFSVLSIIIAAVVSLSFTLTLIIITNIFIALIAGFFLTIIFVLYFATSKKKEKSVPIHDNLENVRVEIDTLRSAKIRYLNNIGFNSEDDYYATKALVKALLFQKENDITRIHQTFEGKEISDYKHEYEQCKNNLLEVQDGISNLGESMSPEEYIKKRRELDMMKLEFTANGDSKTINSEDQINILRAELDKLRQFGTNGDSIELFKKYMQEYYSQEINFTADYILENKEITSYEQKVELMIIGRLAYIKAEFPAVELPLLLEDPFVGIEDHNLIKKIVEFCSSKIQTILISEHEKYTNMGFFTINKVD